MSNILNKILDKKTPGTPGTGSSPKPVQSPNTGHAVNDLASDFSFLSTSPAAAAMGPRPKKQKMELKDLSLLRTLGTGSFGRVHLIQKKNGNQYYAMKVMKKTEVVRLKQVEHTMNEKKILDEINHPFLVNLIGSFQDSANLYFVLEYVSGGELFSFLRRSQVGFMCIRRYLILSEHMTSSINIIIALCKWCRQILRSGSCVGL